MLYGTSVALSIFSFIIIAIGLYVGVYDGLIEPMQPGHTFAQGDKMQLAAGFALLFLGCLGLVVSQIASKVNGRPAQ